MAVNISEKITLTEKASLCSGADVNHTKSVGRLDIPSITICDGPHGLRKQADKADRMGINASVKATCFPTASAIACSFDRELLFKIGEALAKECLSEGVDVLLSPGLNQKRSPLCGRSFEYFSEDPLTSGELAASMIRGLQSKGVGACLKHFAVNNQESRRMAIDAVIDERALRETYLPAFEYAVKRGKPWLVMSAYNKVNGTFASQHKRLITDILRKEWGFEGLVVSDWGAVADRVAALEAGEDLEMPTSYGFNDSRIVKAVQNTILPEATLDATVERIVQLAQKTRSVKKPTAPFNKAAHHALAVEAARQSAVLLKNENHLLPGKITDSVAVIGRFAKHPRYQGGGSSRVEPIQVDSAWDAFAAAGVNASYAAGYSEFNDIIDEKLIAEAVTAVRSKEKVYLFVGLPDTYESEGFDRKTLSMPQSHLRLIDAVSAVHRHVTVILCCGSVVEIPWADKISAILLPYLSGEGGGTAIVDLLLGKHNPCGKLAETWVTKLEDTPSYAYFPGGNNTVEYRESIFVGYRYYEAACKNVRFPFGFGLSYTTFALSDLRATATTATVTVSNTGERTGSTVVQLYAAHKNETVFMPVKQLCAFEKVALSAGETREITLPLEARAFCYYNTKIDDWYSESREYTIWAGFSSADTPLAKVITINNETKPQPDYRKDTPSYFSLSSGILNIPDKEFAALMKADLRPVNVKLSRPFDLNATLEDVRGTFAGRLLCWLLLKFALKTAGKDKTMREFVRQMLLDNPLRSLSMLGGARMTPKAMQGVLDLINGKYLCGIKNLMLSKSTEEIL